MKRLQLCALLFLATGCSHRTPAPVVAVAPRPSATMAPTLAPVVVPIPAPNATIANMSAKERQSVLSQIQMLKTASPDQDFETAWAAQDYRFSTLHGAGDYSPGLPDKRLLKLINRYGAKYIEGTGDFMRIPEQAQLQTLATRYATRYNQLLLARLDEQASAAQLKDNSNSPAESAAPLAQSPQNS